MNFQKLFQRIRLFSRFFGSFRLLLVLTLSTKTQYLKKKTLGFDSREGIEHVSAAANILVCDMDETYTVLNRYNPKTHFFEGEYSLLHNAYSQDAYFLSKFLMEHKGHQLVLLDSESERYYHIKRDYHHYGDDDIERYLAELAEQRQEQQRDLEVQQNVGQLQLLIAKKMIEQEWESVQQKESKSEKDTYVLLGQDFAFRRSLQTINQVVNFGQE